MALSDLTDQIVSRTSDGTPVNNSTTLVSDTVLTFPVDAGHKYRFDAQIIFTSATAADMKFGWLNTGTITMDWGSDLSNQGIAVGSTPVTALTESDTLSTGGAGAAVKAICRFGGVIHATTAGTVTLQMAQATANGSDSTIKSGSSIRYKRQT